MSIAIQPMGQHKIYSLQICSLLRGGIAERGGIRVGHRIIEINHLSVVAVPHERIVNMLATATGEIHMKVGGDRDDLICYPL